MTDAATAYFASAAEIQKRPITEAQWADAVEAYQRAKLMKDAVDDLVKAFAQQSGATSAQVRYALKARADSKEAEARDDLQGRLELLGGGECSGHADPIGDACVWCLHDNFGDICHHHSLREVAK